MCCIVVTKINSTKSVSIIYESKNNENEKEHFTSVVRLAACN